MMITIDPERDDPAMLKEYLQGTRPFFSSFFLSRAHCARDSARAVANPIQPICYEILFLLIRLGKLAVF